jgi:hypothetical protein
MALIAAEIEETNVEPKTEARRGTVVAHVENGTDKNNDHSDHSPLSRNDLSTHLAQTKALLIAHSSHMEEMTLLQAEHEARMRTMLDSVPTRRSSDFLDLSHLWTYLDRIQGTVEGLVGSPDSQRHEEVEKKAAVRHVDVDAVIERLDRLQAAVEENSAVVRRMLEEKSAVTLGEVKSESISVPARKEVAHEGQSSVISSSVKQVDDIRNAVETIKPELLAIREATTENSKQMRSFLKLQRKQDPSARPTESDMRSLNDKVNSISASLFRRPEHESDLSTRINKLQSASDRTASFVEALTEQQATTLTSLEQTSSQIRTFIKSSQLSDVESKTKLDIANAEVKELGSGHREISAAVERLFRETREQSCCGHVASPPPRKVGRKIVGYVYAS